MALKDWKKRRVTGYNNLVEFEKLETIGRDKIATSFYVAVTNNNAVYIRSVKESGKYNFNRNYFSDTQEKQILYKSFKTKSAALKYAKDYMRKH